MKVLVTGSRTWTDRQIIHDALHHLLADDVLIHGANGKLDWNKERTRKIWYGADILCEQFALVHSIPVRPYPVTDEEWKEFGLAAGPRRNRRMYDAERPDQVIAFRMAGKSSGTDGMVKIALAGGTPILVYYFRDGDPQHGLFSPTSWASYCQRIGRNT